VIDPNDPFKPMQAASAPSDQPAMLDTAIAQGKPRKNLMMVGMALAIALVMAWMLWPQSKYTKKPPVVAPQGADGSSGVPNMGAQLMQQLQRQAVGPAPAASKIAPAEAAPKAPISVLPYQQASGAAVNALTPEEKAKQRRDLIWSSSPVIASVSLMKQSASTPVGASNASLSPLEAAKLALAQAMPHPAAPAAPAHIVSTAGGSPNQQFLASQESADNAAPVREHAAYGQSVLMQGTVIRAVTLSGIDTDLPGSITARVVSNVYDSVHPSLLLIPKGSTLIGEYNSNFKVGQSRILVAMNRLILPDGQWISLAATPATDAQGMSGMVADVNNHFLKMFSASFVIGATSLLLPSSQQNITVTSPTNSGTQTGGTIFAQTLQQTVQQLLQRNVSIPPTGTVQPGTPFDFMVSRDMLISPYEGSN
jgi:type IV secretion system protein VirB10